MNMFKWREGMIPAVVPEIEFFGFTGDEIPSPLLMKGDDNDYFRNNRFLYWRYSTVFRDRCLCDEQKGR